MSEYVQREEGLTAQQPVTSFINPAAAFLNNPAASFNKPPPAAVPNPAAPAPAVNPALDFANPAAFQFNPAAVGTSAGAQTTSTTASSEQPGGSSEASVSAEKKPVQPVSTTAAGLVDSQAGPELPGSAGSQANATATTSAPLPPGAVAAVPGRQSAESHS